MLLRTFTAGLALLALLAFSLADVTYGQKPEKEFGAGGFGEGGFGAGGFDRKEKAPPTLMDVIDADGDGAITDLEARAAVNKLMALPKSKEMEAKELAKTIDKNGDNKINQNEALYAIAKVRMQNDENGRKMDEVFQQLDANKDEIVSREEFNELRDKLRDRGEFGEFGGGFGRFSTTKIFEAMDADRDGNVNIVEAQFVADQFVQMTDWRKRREAADEAKLKQQTAAAFSGMDKNRDQRLTKRETSGEIEEQFDTIDTDQNGKLTVNELFQYAKQKGAPAQNGQQNGQQGQNN